jgi:DNA-binding PadR family transcriptional regulator
MVSSKPVMSVRHAILVLLSEGPMSWPQLCEELAARTGEVWPVNVDQVYATLRRLERDGLVESDGACEESPPGRGVSLPNAHSTHSCRAKSAIDLHEAGGAGR